MVNWNIIFGGRTCEATNAENSTDLRLLLLLVFQFKTVQYVENGPDSGIAVVPIWLVGGGRDGGRFRTRRFGQLGASDAHLGQMLINRFQIARRAGLAEQFLLLQTVHWVQAPLAKRLVRMGTFVRIFLQPQLQLFAKYGKQLKLQFTGQHLEN